MKILLALVAFFQITGHSQNKEHTSRQNQTVTVILVRHAEKEKSGDDPELSAEGRQRANELAEMLRETHIDVIYSTPFKRTKQTMLPLADLKNLPVKEYSASMPYAQFINKLSGEHRGKVILIAGHSNTIPEILKVLSKGAFNISIDESEYDNLFIVTGITEERPTVLHLKYGNRTAQHSVN